MPLPEKPDTARTFTSADALGAVPKPVPPREAGVVFFLLLLGFTAHSGRCWKRKAEADDGNKEKDNTSLEHVTMIAIKKHRLMLS